MLHALFFCYVIPLCLCFCPYVLLSLPIPTDTFCLGSAAATARTWEATCSTAGAAGSAEVPVRSDPVFTAAAPAAASRAEETENSCCRPDHAGGGGLMKNIGSWLLSYVCMWHSAFRQICVPFYLEEMCLWSAATQPCRCHLNHCFIAILKHNFFCTAGRTAAAPLRRLSYGLPFSAQLLVRDVPEEPGGANGGQDQHEKTQLHEQTD